MKVDLSKAKAGDTVKFRCGGEAVIEEMVWESSVCVSIDFVGQENSTDYFEHGKTRYGRQLLDITAIIPAQFDLGEDK